MVVVEVVNDAAALAAADNKAEVAKQPELVGDRGRFHLDGVGELVDARGARAQSSEDPNPAGRGERLHGVGNRLHEVGVELVGVAQLTVSHTQSIAV